jgi:glycosyltransferase involved in cell wall biosynthesis
MKICFELIKANSGVDVWTFNLSKALRGLGVETVINEYSHGYQFCPDLLRFSMKKTKADIVHASSLHAFAFKRDVPLVVTEHPVVNDKAYDKYKDIPQKLFHGLVYGFEKRSFLAADKIVCVSDYTKDKVKEIFGFDPVRIHNGIDIKRFFPGKVEGNRLNISRGKIVLLFVGNMSKRKGADLLPGIMKALGEDFVLICTSGLRKAVEKVQDNIYVIGKLSQDELVDYYNLCDMFVFPTRLEGLSLSVAEAMSCGKPIVTTRCASLPEQVVDGEGGFLCGIDDTGDFADKIRILAGDPVLRKKFGVFNRERTERSFSIEKMARNYLELYTSLVSS